MTKEQFVQARYPDAYLRKYAKLSLVIWCPLLDRRLSGFFHTEEEAWDDAVKWIEKHEGTLYLADLTTDDMRQLINEAADTGSIQVFKG